ncbi:MAG: helix-hairpin-helix domain-containing protein, partial [Acidobacteriota bacterium]|nr:helix-hairpin-helix domain-containing protein [Acidobacteriota bacterium]
AVPLTVLEGVTAATTSALAEHGIEDIDTLANTSLDDLVEYLDISFDEAESIIASAQIVVAVRDKSKAEETGDEESAAEGAETVEGEGDEITESDETTGFVAVSEPLTEEGAPELMVDESEPIEQHAVSAEFDPSSHAGEVEPSEAMTAEGYDEAVEQRAPFQAEPEILAQDSADPVALTEAEPVAADELILQEAGRDLRPDTITPSPDITSTGAAMFADEAAAEEAEEVPVEEDEPFAPLADASEASAPEIQVSSAPAPEYRVETNDETNAAQDHEKPEEDASGSAQ